MGLLNHYMGKTGFTLIEIIIALAILAITFSFALGFDIPHLRRTSFADSEHTFVAALQNARSQAVNGICSGTCTSAVAHGVHIETNHFVEFQGNFYNPSDPQNFSHSVTSGNYFLATTDIIFQPLSGDATVTTIILIGQNNSASTTITNDGEILW